MIYQEQKDETLVSATLLGDQTAYEALVVRWQKSVLSAARQITRSEPLAEDAAQDAFVTAWLKLNTLHDGSKYGIWVTRIAKNRAKDLLMHYREWVDADLVAAEASDVLAVMSTPDETELLHENVSALSEKVRKVITLYYFEGYSIAEIAQMLAIPRGTVKARLHDGRNKLRKEYGLVNEKDTDTLLEKVMKKIEELKLWRFRNDKTGFDTVWRECLAAVEDLPESKQKYHALADTLMHGYWWVEGEANDEVLARIRDAAERSHNEETMKDVIAYEMTRVSGQERIQSIREELIPRMEEQKFIKAQGYLHFWLGYELIESGDKAGGLAEFQKTLDVLTPADVYHACAQAAIAGESADLPERSLRDVTAEEYRNIDGQYRFWIQPGYCRENIQIADLSHTSPGYYSAMCEGRTFLIGAQVGDSYTSADGKISLTFEQDGVSVQTPCGVFTNCQIWRSQAHFTEHDQIVKTYYKDGVGIVRQECGSSCYRTATCVLSDYTIVGGSGLLPFAVGNQWNYTIQSLDQKFTPHVIHREITYADGQRAIASQYITGARLGYDPDSWEEAVLELREQYYTSEIDPQTNDYHIVDVSAAAERAERLARTPLEKAHTKAACAVARQMMDGEPMLHAEPKTRTHWTFFSREVVLQDRPDLRTGRNSTYSFEWKDMGVTDWTPGTWESRHALLYNDIYGILQSTAGTLWSDDWVAGAQLTRKFFPYNQSKEVTAQITVSDAGTVTTAAGSFENCLEVKITCKGLTGGLSYRADPKEYYFAPGVGIIKTVHHYGNHAEHSGVYELSSYIGTGEGYFPLERGMERVYDAVGLTDGYVSQSTYTCEQDEDGTLCLLAARLGYRNL